MKGIYGQFDLISKELATPRKRHETVSGALIGGLSGVLFKGVALKGGLAKGGYNVLQGRELGGGEIACVSGVCFVDVYFGEKLLRSFEDASLKIDDSTVRDVSFEGKCRDLEHVLMKMGSHTVGTWASLEHRR